MPSILRCLPQTMSRRVPGNGIVGCCASVAREQASRHSWRETLANDVAALADQRAKSPQQEEKLEGTALKMFKQIDTDNSGSISRDEFNAWWPKWQRQEAATLFAQIDIDNDGEVSSAEFAAWWTKREGLLTEMRVASLAVTRWRGGAGLTVAKGGS